DNIGDTLVGQTRGGSVCEIVVNASCFVEIPGVDGNDDGVCDDFETCLDVGPQTINESTSIFEIDGGASTGFFAGASGFGSIHAIFDFCIAAELAFGGATPATPLDRAFLVNEISLKLD
ncbi:MAG: hypothetical protein IID48_19160, partial [Proteobacteria bacterium]|nr:hypothetical protein [Pseudomonadota bacterium]